MLRGHQSQPIGSVVSGHDVEAVGFEDDLERSHEIFVIVNE
jgi:hypothetical protein